MTHLMLLAVLAAEPTPDVEFTRIETRWVEQFDSEQAQRIEAYWKEVEQANLKQWQRRQRPHLALPMSEESIKNLNEIWEILDVRSNR